MKLKLKEIRQSRGLNQTDVAKKLNITQASYSHYENERNQPTYELLIKIADLFKVSVDELLGHEIPYLIDKSLLSNEELAIISEIKELDTIQRIKVLAYIDGLKQGKERQQTIIKKFEEK